MRKCTKCDIHKEENKQNFSWITNKNRYEAQCRICRNERKNELNRIKRKKFIESADYVAPKRSRKSKEYYQNYKRKWIEENREHIKKVVHENYLKNREKVLERTRKWRQKNPEKFKKMWDKSTEKYPHKLSARRLLKRAIYHGKIIRPSACCLCGASCKPEAHHEDYSKPLEVKWLCRSCHAYVHRIFK